MRNDQKWLLMAIVGMTTGVINLSALLNVPMPMKSRVVFGVALFAAGGIAVFGLERASEE